MREDNILIPEAQQQKLIQHSHDAAHYGRDGLGLGAKGLIRIGT